MGITDSITTFKTEVKQILGIINVGVVLAALVGAVVGVSEKIMMMMVKINSIMDMFKRMMLMLMTMMILTLTSMLM